MNRDSCDMRRVTSQKNDDGELEPGDFYFEADDTGQRWFCFCYPNGVGARIPIRPLLNAGTNNGHSWQWDGNEDTPTLTPSINAEGMWHGYVTAGRMVSC